MENIKIKRRTTSAWWIERKTEEVDQEYMKGAESCESIADMSSYVPNKEIMRKAATGQINGQALYDFQDGKDDGRKVPVSRIKGKDIAELSEEIKKQQDSVKNKITEAQEKAEEEARAKQSLEAYKSAISEANKAEQ